MKNRRLEYTMSILPAVLVIAVPVALVGALIMHAVAPKWKGVLRR